MVLCTVPIGNFYLIHSVIPHGSGIGSQQIPDHFNRIWDLGSGILFFIHRTEIFSSTADHRKNQSTINPPQIFAFMQSFLPLLHYSSFTSNRLRCSKTRRELRLVADIFILLPIDTCRCHGAYCNPPSEYR